MAGNWTVTQGSDGSGALVDNSAQRVVVYVFPTPAEAYAAMKAAEKMAPWPLKEDAR